MVLTVIKKRKILANRIRLVAERNVNKLAGHQPLVDRSVIREEDQVIVTDSTERDDSWVRLPRSMTVNLMERF